MLTITGTPFVGYVSLTNGAPGPVVFALYTLMGAAAYALQPADRLVITNITLSSNDTAAALVTIDTGGTTPTKLARSYLSSSLPPVVESVPPGVCRGAMGTVPRAAATAITAGKTVECAIKGYVSRAVVAAFTPAQIPGLALWLDSALGITLNGATVSAWADQSGNGFNATQAAGTNQPTYNTKDVAYGGAPTLSFGATSFMSTATLNITQPNTWYVVGEAPTAPDTTYHDFLDFAGGARQFIAAHSTTGRLDIFAGTELISTTAVPNTKCVMCGVMNGGSSAAYLNASQTSVSSGAAGASGSGNICLGANNGTGNFLNGKLAAVIGGSGAHSAAQRAQVFAYLASRFAIAGVS